MVRMVVMVLLVMILTGWVAHRRREDRHSADLSSRKKLF
jgi:hypothetical protein